jgi:hypothetical protein
MYPDVAFALGLIVFFFVAAMFNTWQTNPSFRARLHYVKSKLLQRPDSNCRSSEDNAPNGNSEQPFEQPSNGVDDDRQIDIVVRLVTKANVGEAAAIEAVFNVQRGGSKRYKALQAALHERLRHDGLQPATEQPRGKRRILINRSGRKYFHYYSGRPDAV